MNVMYDISTLGTAHYNNRGRTGIARVIEDLLEGLLRTEKCNVCFSAFNSLDQLIQTAQYLDTHPHLKNHFFCQPDSNTLNQVVNIIGRLYPNSKSLASSSLARFRRRALSFFLKGLTPLCRSLDQGLLEHADIIHSTFYPLPHFVRSNPTLKRFITLYDMIPILFPQYFEPRMIDNFNNIINSLRPDDWVLAISQCTKNDFCHYLDFDPSRVFVTPLAASERFYRCNNEVNKAAVRKKYCITSAPYILSVCTLEPRKNIDHTIRCFIKTIQEQHISDLNLVLVGTKGWNFDKVFSEISKSPKMANRIIVTGYVPDEDLAPLYSDAMMFVYPSLYEGFGLPPLEAMQCGIPVITSNTSSLPEVVGSAGIMIDPLDKDALAHAMWSLYQSPSERLIMADKSLQQASSFSWDRCAQQTIDAYKHAINS